MKVLSKKGRILVIVGCLISICSFPIFAFAYEAGEAIFIIVPALLIPIIMAFLNRPARTKDLFPKYFLVVILGLALTIISQLRGTQFNWYVAVGIVICSLIGIFYKPLERYIRLIVTIGCITYPLEYIFYNGGDYLIICSVIAVWCIILMFMENLFNLYSVIRFISIPLLVFSSVVLITSFNQLIGSVYAGDLVYIISAVFGSLLITIGGFLLTNMANTESM